MSTAGTLRPTVISRDAHYAFQEKARSMRLNPDDPWIGGYVDYEWDHLRLVMDAMPLNVRNQRVLEFGCNVGASAILFSLLGAEVDAVDVAQDWIHLAELNATRYGAIGIRFHHVPDTRTLPFPDGHFDLVSCNSVLEYVDQEIRQQVQNEIDRVLRPGGKIMLQGTSNRLWPREVHSRRWLVNYLPLEFDALLGKKLQRGMWPWEARHGFGPNYVNLDIPSQCGYFVRSRIKLGAHPTGVRLLTALAAPFGVGPGLLTPNISCLLQKQMRR